MTAQTQTMTMTTTTTIQSLNGKKFDVCLMNPPYDNLQQFLDMQFVEKVNEIANNQIVVHPAKRWVSDTKLGKQNAESGHLKELDIVDANKGFNISVEWKWAGIFYYDNTKSYNKYNVNFNNQKTEFNINDYEGRNDFYRTLDIPADLKNIVLRHDKLYNSLLKKYKTMVNDGHGFVYEENDLSRGKKKYNLIKNDEVGPVSKHRLELYQKWLEEGKYKYCLYKGSFNNAYDEVQEWKGQDPYKLFKGQILWLTNSETVKNNIKYWLECPLCDLWRRYMFKFLTRRAVSGCAYGLIPALDFEMSESDFKKYVDSLNDFTPDEIKILKENNIHNADKL